MDSPETAAAHRRPRRCRMMVAGVLVLFVVFIGTRFAIVRSTANSTIANVAAAAIVFAFVLGSISRTFTVPAAIESAVNGSTAAASDVPAGPAAPAAPVVAVTLSNVTWACHKGVRVVPGGVGSLDFLAPKNAKSQQIVDGGSLARDTSYVAVGWGADVTKTRAARAVCLISDLNVVTTARSKYGLSRPDVAKAYDRQELTQSGFEITIPVGALAAGLHHVAVAIESSDGSFALSPNSFTITVR